MNAATLISFALVVLTALFSGAHAGDITLTGNIYANTTTCSGAVFQSYSEKASSLDCVQYYDTMWLQVQCAANGGSITGKACNSSDCTSCVDFNSIGSGNCTVLDAPGVTTPLSGTFSCSSAFGLTPAAGLLAMVGVIAAALVL